MAKFQIDANGKKYEIEAPDQASALKALEGFAASTPPATPASGGNAYDAFMAEAQAIHDKTVKPLEGNPLTDFSRAATAGALQGMTFGFADEATAGVETPFRVIGDLATGRGFDPGRAYEEALTGARDYLEEEQARNPVGGMAGDVLGSLITGGTLAKGGLTLMNGAQSLPGLVGRGAIEGAAYGGLSGAGRSEAEDLTGRLADAGTGAAWGGVLGGGTSGLVGALAGKAAKAAVPTVDDLKAEAGALYAKAENSGVTFPKAEVKTVADDISALAITEGIDPTLHPRATAALKRLMEAADTGMTVQNAQTMRRILAAASKDPMNPDEARIVGKMLEKFDDMVAAKSPELAEARAIYHQAKKGELIEQAIELARIRAGQYGNGGMENALRTEFRALARKIEKGQLKGLSAEEVSAINKVAEGGPVENILRWVGKAAPTGVVSAGLSTGVPFAVGNAAGGPALGAMLAGGTMGAGIAGKTAAGAMTTANALKAALLARNGGIAPKWTLSAGQRKALGALLSGSGNEAATIPKRVPLEILVTGGNPALAE